MTQSVIGTFCAIADRYPDRIAVSCGDERVSYSQLAARIAREAASYSQVNGTVLIFLPQGIDAIVKYMAAIWAGAVPSFMPLPSSKQDPKHYWSAHTELVNFLRPCTIITTEEHALLMKQFGMEGAAHWQSL